MGGVRVVGNLLSLFVGRSPVGPSGSRGFQGFRVGVYRVSEFRVQGVL